MGEYYRILLMALMCVSVATAIFGISYILIYKNTNWDKVSAYECGFQPFEDSRNRFDVKFYLVAILFIIFDLEIAFLFPWSLCLDSLNIEGISSMLIFLFILLIGFIYEWKKGALDWY